MASHLDALSYAYDAPIACGVIKSQPEDFLVEEFLSFSPSGEGDHLFLNITKHNLTTNDLTLLLSKHFSVSIRDIGYAGMKDKHAVTSQWLSVPIHSCADYSQRVASFADNSAGAVINESVLHNKKLKRGTVQKNSFVIKLKNITGEMTGILDRMELIKSEGFPNYFTEQRFGIDDKNVLRAELLLNGKMKEKNKRKRGIYYSAARSFLFNLLLSERIAGKSWKHALAGDVLMLANNQSVFMVDEPDADIVQRINNHALDIALPLFGTMGLQSRSSALDYENKIHQQHAVLCEGLVNAGLERHSRRARVLPENIDRDVIDKQTLQLSFALPVGSYATALLRELVRYAK